jgi:hypothetical protein
LVDPVPSAKSWPRTSRGARKGFVVSTPLSTTATVTPRPVLAGQAAGILSNAMPYFSPANGAVGEAKAL